MDSKIKVGVRIRPLNNKELEASSSSVICSDSGKYVVTKAPAKKNSFEYDWSFDNNSTNRMVYDMSCRPLIENIFDGFNCTFFAYGQTSSGKTHTLGGSDMNEGVIPFALQDIFERSKDLHALGTKVDIEVSYIEIYREECFDLLSVDGTRVKLDLKETSNGKTVLDGITNQPVADIDSVMKLLRDGAKVRSTGQTAMNAHSSRSHSICTLNVRVVRATTGTVVSQLHLVDLAGSERAKKTQATGDAFQEGISINRGLLALGNVVSALSSRTPDSGHVHVPYRESKLTRLLKDALGGNGMTVMLACVSPADSNLEETINTLRFASRASAIVNSARVNHSVGDTDTVSLLKEISDLRAQLTLLQSMPHQNGAKSTAAVRFDTSSGNNKITAPSAQPMDPIVLQKQNNAYLFMVTSALRVTSSLKSVLLTCLQEGSYVVDSDLVNIQSELQQIRRGLNLPSTEVAKIKSEPASTALTATATDSTKDSAASASAELADLDMESMLQLPPIMTLVEEVRMLERDLRSVEKAAKKLCNGCNDSTSIANTTSNNRNMTLFDPRESLSDADWADDSLISGTDVSILQSSDDPHMPMDNLSFEHSFRSDNNNDNESFNVDCSFNILDAMNIENEIANFMSEQNGASSGGTSTSAATIGGTNGANGATKMVKMSFQEEEEARQASKGLLAKEAEVNRIAALTDKYQSSIRALKSEISALENDQEKLQSRQTQNQQNQNQKKPLSSASSSANNNKPSTSSSSSSNNNTSVEDMRIKQQLREKTKLLEEKIKLLRTKESEFGKISIQKTRLVGEVETMKKVVEEHKRKRADLQRKMRDEQVVHRQETTQIKHSEIQARRRELQAQQNVLRLEGQLQSKEKVWKAQLEGKERESKQLKELVGKQQTVRNMQALAGKGSSISGASGGNNSSSMLAAAGALLSSQGSSGLTTKEALDLKLWVDGELEAQCKRMQTQESLSKELLARTQAARQLQSARAAVAAANASTATTTTSTESEVVPSAAAMKALENEIRARSSTIASLNGVLVDLGSASVVDKKRFSRFTDLKQAKTVSEVLFELCSKTQRREQSATRRLRAMQEQLNKTRKQLSEANNTVQFYQEQAARRVESQGYIFDDEESETAEMDETFYPTDESDADNSDASDSDASDSYRKNKGKTSKATKFVGNKKNTSSSSTATANANKRKSDSSTNSSFSLNESSESLAPPSKKQRSKGAARVNKRRISDDNEDDRSGAENNAPSEESGSDSDGSDSENDAPAAKKAPAKRKNNAASGPAKKSSAVTESVSPGGTVTTIVAPKRVKRVHAVDPDFNDAEITFPLQKHTINELKRFLGCKGLPVSGVKAELIERLGKALSTRETPVYGEVDTNDENVVPVNASTESAASYKDELEVVEVDLSSTHVEI